MRFSFGATATFTGEEPLRIFSWLRKFVKACDDNEVSEGMALYLIPHFLSGEAEARFTRYLPGGGSDKGVSALTTYPHAVNWLLSTYAEPHTLGLAQDAFSRATLGDKETVEAFSARLRGLAELCGNIHSEGTMKQQLIQGLPEYLRADAFVYNEAHRSYQQLTTYVGGKFRSALDVVALAPEGKPTGVEPSSLIAALWNDLVGDAGLDWTETPEETSKTAETPPTKGRREAGNA
ncbi:hypothetical protein MMPV_009240 [Pyropia vietnamensis]